MALELSSPPTLSDDDFHDHVTAYIAAVRETTDGKLARVAIVTNYYDYVAQHLGDRLRESGVLWTNFASDIFLNSREYLQQYNDGVFDHLNQTFVEKMVEKCKEVNVITRAYLYELKATNRVPSVVRAMAALNDDDDEIAAMLGNTHVNFARL